jgi:4-hydroxybenzoate polyprenyltransferase/phosphoglycolate phosphatase-like HAD superfamily hydrolase
MSDGERIKVLAVDLDGTLLRSDMLYESFWAALSGNFSTPLIALRGLSGGRAQLKSSLAGLATIDVTLLPYNEAVIERVKAWRERGGRAILVTASDRTLAQRIADHLGIFDEVHGSDGQINLKSRNKAAFLEDRYGHGGYAYMGDHRADLPVWSRAGHVIAVAPDASLRAKIGRLHPGAEYIDRPRGGVRPYMKAIRPHQWLKNLLVFLPMLAAHMFDATTALRSLIAFFAFSLLASSVYVVNDLLDLSADRIHPRKRKRPFASGAVPIAHGTVMGLGLFAGGMGLSLLLGPLLVVTMLAYFALTSAYSLVLKRRAIVDICTLATLYAMRIIAGGVATDIPLSVWLLAFALFFFFSLAAVKRQAELVDAAAAGRLSAHGRGYHAHDLDIVSQMATASGFVSVMVLALYVNSREVVALYRHPQALWGICIVLLYWISRMVMITHRGHMHDDPIVYATKDRNSYVCGVIVVIFALAGVWF